MGCLTNHRCPTCGRAIPATRRSTWRYCTKQCQYRQGSEPPARIRAIETFFRELDRAMPWERDRVRDRMRASCDA